MSTLKTTDGLELHYQVDDRTDPSRAADTVVLLHGNAKNLTLWNAWVPLLAEQYRVVRLDARGFGASGIPEPGYVWSLADFAGDVVQLLDHLGISRAHVIGETMGGCIVLQLARQYPQRVSSVCVCSTPHDFRTKTAYWDMIDLINHEGVEGWARNQGRIYHRPDWYVREMSKTSPRVLTEVLAYLTTVDLTPELPHIEAPALVLTGERAPDADNFRLLASLLPRGRFVAVPGISGYVQAEAPTQCVDIWRAFVEGGD